MKHSRQSGLLMVSPQTARLKFGLRSTRTATHPNRLGVSASVMTPIIRPDTVEEIDTTLLTASLTPWSTVVWNDPVNLMSYVSYVFRTYFGFSESDADRLMLQVHNDGRAIVATGSREEMERHVEAMHGFGLWATLMKADE